MPEQGIGWRLAATALVALPLGIAFVALVARAWRAQRVAFASRRWRSVPGVVIWSGVQELQVPVRSRPSIRRYRMAIRYVPRVVYEYAVGGSRYQGHQLRWGDRIASSDPSGPRREAERYPVGNPVPVMVDPADPTISTLHTRVTTGTIAEWVSAVAVLAITALVVAVIWMVI
jgi:hypothetical protein